MRNNGSFLVRAGLIAGVVTLYISVIGMLEAFSGREVIRNVLTLAQVMLVGASIVAGFLAARRLHTAPLPTKLLAGAVVGLLSALPLIALIFISNQIDLRSVLINITRRLITLITLQQEDQLTGIMLLLLLFTASGAAGTLIETIPPRLRRALVAGFTGMLIIGVLSELVRQILQQFLDRETLRLILNRNSLNPEAAVIIFVVIFLIGLFWPSITTALRHRIANLPNHQQRNIQRGQFSLLGIFLLILPWLVGTAMSDVLDNVGLFILMGLGLNIAVGLAGLLDLGYVTNFAVGAYVMGVLTSTGPLGIEAKAGVEIFNFWLVLPISLLVAMLTGFIFAVPVLRMRGDYLAIATLGFGEIIRLLAISDWLKPVIGGAQGVLFIPKPEIFGTVLNEPQQLYYVILAGCIFAIYVSTRLNNSRTGRQWMAIREDEDVAAAMGINTARAKLLAFTLSAATGGLAGAIFASKLGTIFPNSFSLQVSINVLSLIIVGGMGSIPGIIIGALVLIGLPELLREFDEFRLLIYGVLLIVMMLARPAGLWPSAVFRRERQQGADESSQTADAQSGPAIAPAGD